MSTRMPKPKREGRISDRLPGVGWYAAPNSLSECSTLSDAEFRVIHNLLRRAGSSGAAFPSIRRIAEDTGKSERRVRIILRGLQSRGVKIRKRFGDNGQQTSNSYDIDWSELLTGDEGGVTKTTPPPLTKTSPPPLTKTSAEVDPVEVDPEEEEGDNNGRLLGGGGVVGGGASRLFHPQHDLEAWAIWRPRLAAAGVSPAKAAEEITRGSEPELVLAWALKCAVAKPCNREAWLTACVRRGHWPREEWYHKQARTLLAPWREARIPGLAFAKLLKSPPPEPGINTRRRQALDELDEAAS